MEFSVDQSDRFMFLGTTVKNWNTLFLFVVEDISKLKKHVWAGFLEND